MAEDALVDPASQDLEFARTIAQWEQVNDQHEEAELFTLEDLEQVVIHLVVAGAGRVGQPLKQWDDERVTMADDVPGPPARVPEPVTGPVDRERGQRHRIGVVIDQRLCEPGVLRTSDDRPSLGERRIIPAAGTFAEPFEGVHVRGVLGRSLRTSSQPPLKALSDLGVHECRHEALQPLLEVPRPGFCDDVTVGVLHIARNVAACGA